MFIMSKFVLYLSVAASFTLRNHNRLCKQLIQIVKGKKKNVLFKPGGRTRLLKFKFSATFPIFLTTTDEKIQNLIESEVQSYPNRKSVEVQPCAHLS